MARSLKSLLSLGAIVLAAGAHANEGIAQPHPGDAARGQPIAATVCAACHGPDGNSPTTAYPRLAGQHAAYLFKQMRNFKPDANGRSERANPIMNGMIAPYSEDQLKDFAAYFAAQKPSAGETRTAEGRELGKKLYRAGDAGKGLPACAGCHGPAGTGLPVQFPRLAGQHPDYIEAQLRAFRAGERANDPNQMMRMVALRMTDAEIRAVADYLAGLH